MNATPVFFVTGASGFIGSNLIRFLNQKGFTPYVLLRETSKLDLLQNSEYISICGDVTDNVIACNLPKSINVIVHCAGATKAISQSAYFKENVEGTMRILSDAKRSLPSLQRIIILSSQSVAGPCQQGQYKSENDVCNPISRYGISKARMEKTIIERFSDMPIIVVRAPSVYGPGDRKSLKFFKMVKAGIIPTVNRNRLTLSFVYIDDLLEGIYRLIEIPEVPDKVYYITSQDEVVIDDLYKLISKHMNRKYLTLSLPKLFVSAIGMASLIIEKVTGKPIMLNPDKLKEMTELRWVVNSERFRSLFPDMLFTPLDSGIEQSLEWYKQMKWI